MTQLYNVVVQILLWWIKRLPESHPYRQWLALREGQYSHLKPEEPSVLFACASVGEYEAIKELAKLLKQRGDRIHLMFFSASGYQYVEAHADYDILSYSPIDTPWQVNQYLRQYPAKAVVISGNNYWPTFLRELRWHSIPYYCLDVRLHPSRYLYNHWVKKQLRQAKLVTTYSPKTDKTLKASNISSLLTVPLRLASLYNQDDVKQPQLLQTFIKEADKLIIYGSTHQEDIDILYQVNLPDAYRLIIAPHHIDENSIQAVQEKYPKAARLSQASEPIKSSVLILDSIGLLKHLYQYADMAYVGGGFKQGIHSILEPSVHGIPIAFGPMHDKFPEAAVLIDSGQATVVNSLSAMQKWIDQSDIDKNSVPTQWNQARLTQQLEEIARQIA